MPGRAGGSGDMGIATGKKGWPLETFALLLLIAFTTELGVMELFDPLFVQLGRFSAAVVDATLLVVISALPLWVIFSPVLSGRLRRDEAARRALGVAFGQLIAGFFLIELIVMLVVPELFHSADRNRINLVDAGLTALLAAPLLWWLLTDLERRHYHLTLAELLESPFLLYLLLLYVVFLSAMLQELIVAESSWPVSHGSHHLIEAAVLMLITAPFLWLFVARPLRRSIQSERARARAVYEQVIDAVVLVDDEGRISALNPAAQRIFGYTEAELVGLTADVLFAEQRQGLEPLLRAAQDVGGGVSREISGRHRYGGTLTMDVSVSPILLGGREDRLLIMRDISDRKEAERALRESDLRFREVYEQSEDAILFFKPGSTYVVDANPTTSQLFGYGKAEILGHGLACLFREENLTRVRDAVTGLRPGQTVQIDHVSGVCSDGRECIVTLRAKIMSLQGVELVYCTVRDITDRVQMEQESRGIQARLIQANKMTSLGLLVSGVAHEINNPNNFIMANAQLLSASWEDVRKVLREYHREHGDFLLGGIPFSELDDLSPQLLNEIVDGSRRINQIVGTLKHFARPERGGIEGEIDVNQVVASTVAILQHELVRHTDAFRCELADDLPWVIGNSQQLGQVVLNLLTNAYQSLPDRQCGIRIATGVDQESSQVTITVQDEGCGISAEDGRQIMEPFFTTKLDRGGTGLGLWICRSIVAEHHGSLDFVSAPGVGSTFIVKIPATKAAAQDENA